MGNADNWLLRNMFTKFVVDMHLEKNNTYTLKIDHDMVKTRKPSSKYSINADCTEFFRAT